MSSVTPEKPGDEAVLFRKSCRNCDFCDGLGDMGEKSQQTAQPPLNDLVEDSNVSFGGMRYLYLLNHSIFSYGLSFRTLSFTLLPGQIPIHLHPTCHDLRCSDRLLQGVYHSFLFNIAWIHISSDADLCQAEDVHRAFNGAEWQGVSIREYLSTILSARLHDEFSPFDR